MKTVNPLEYLLAPLSPTERQEFMDIATYLTSNSQSDKPPVEGSVAAVLAKASPLVRATYKTLSDTLETPRIMPFQPKMSEADHADSFGFDGATTANIKERIDQDYVMSGIQEKMGTDADLPDEPLTLRDMTAAAFDLHNSQSGE